VIRFTSRDVVPVRAPYRLDLTVDALRRLAANVVDVVEDGAYYRALPAAGGVHLVRVVQIAPGTLEVRTTARAARALVERVTTMLGARAELGEWFARTASIPWLHALALACEGVRPPRYASLFEACAHAIVFQQISIHAAAAIMRRLVETLGVPSGPATAFPSPRSLLDAPAQAFDAVGLSANKLAHLRSVAEAVESGAISDAEIESLPTPQAAERLVSIRGIGPWSAAVVLLRGFGRLDTFPMRDSGVARTIALLSGDPAIDLDALLERLGPVRGLLYYHLLLGRIRNLAPPERD
jgi:DNA-3-methyladenine glycosylase II